VPRVNLAYLDIRFSNVCNFRCRTCGPAASTGWYRDFGPDPRFVRAIRPAAKPGDLIRQIEPFLPHVEQVYFAGGEPAVTMEHYLMLERLIEANRTDVRISYSTNFSTFRFMHWDLLELWSHFRNITLGASLDGSGPRGEYLRKGQQWDKVVENRRLLGERCPHVSFRLSSTLSNMNSLHLPDFHEEWVKSGLVDTTEIHINILQDPMHYRLTALPAHIKDRVAARYEDHAGFISRIDGGSESIAGAWRAAIRFMYSHDDAGQMPEFRRQVTQMDERRGESFAATFPELAELVG
jgi:MoaA/NifB/PqqE/SkfB family radical SAM enzyme